MSNQSTAGEALDLNKTRAEFEAWAIANGYPTGKADDGDYTWGTFHAWAGYRAALARAGSAAPAGQQAVGAGEVDAKDARITALRSALQEISEVRFGHEGDCGTTRIADDALYADEVAAQPKDTTDTRRDA